MHVLLCVVQSLSGFYVTLSFMMLIQREYLSFFVEKQSKLHKQVS